MPNTQEQSPWQKPLLVFGRMSAWVATPVIASLFIGKFLDEKFGTAPFIFLGMTGLAFIISCYGIYRETTAYLKDIESNDTNNSTTSK